MQNHNALGESLKKTIVVSAINLVEGGPLTILKECLDFLSTSLCHEYRIIALVNKKELACFKNVEYLEFPESKKSWINRIFYEYYFFKKLSRQLKPFLWLSLHDMTPNVSAERLAVYCHNPAIFYKLSLREAVLEPKLALFNMFYKHLYRINLKKNDWVIVQQGWIRDCFKRFFGINNVVVAYPTASKTDVSSDGDGLVKKSDEFLFFYPAFPRVFKNFEVICEAARLLSREENVKFKIGLTLKGDENRYARSIFKKYGEDAHIELLGILPRRDVFSRYRSCDCLIFASKLETWGLPITEFKNFNKPILCADRPYAYEAIDCFKKVCFFNPDDPRFLSRLMKEQIDQKAVYDPVEKNEQAAPFSRGWRELFQILLSEKKPHLTTMRDRIR